MAAIASLLITLTLSLLVTRVAAMALMLTGMPRESARFQARSAFCGVGYTTHEAEEVLAHPVRRRIVMLLMLLGNLGVATVVATVVLSVVKTAESDKWWLALFALGTGLLMLWMVSSSRFVERHLNRVISWVLRRWGNLQVQDYQAILQLQNGFSVSELHVGPNDWLAEKTLTELRLPAEGVLILGIRRASGEYVGTPTGEMTIRAHDTLMLYGPGERIEELNQRRRGKKGMWRIARPWSCTKKSWKNLSSPTSSNDPSFQLDNESWPRHMSLAKSPLQPTWYSRQWPIFGNSHRPCRTSSVMKF